MTFCFSFEFFVTFNPIEVNIRRGGPTYLNTKQRGGMKTVQKLPDSGSYSTVLPIFVVSYFKLVKDLVEKNK